jgi:dTDP-4-amino-4,6-dideoxygalactose transaminase
MIKEYEINLEKKDLLGSFKEVFGSGHIKELEKYYSREFGRYAYAVGSGSDAIFVILKDIEKIKGKGEVLCPNYSCKAIPRSIIKAGFIPVFIDMDDSFSMDIDLIKKAISKKTRAILVYHPGGFLSNPKQFKLAKEKGITLIEDCAKGFGLTKEGKKMGSFGDYSFFSFRTGKLINSGSGSVIISKKEIKIDLKNYPKILTFFNLADLLLREKYNFTKLKPIFDYFFDKIGPYKIGNSEAFLTLIQLKKIKKISSKRRENLTILRKVLIGGKIKSPNFLECIPAPLSFPILTENKEEVIKMLIDKGIGARDYYNHVNSDIFNFPYFGREKSEEIAHSLVNIPLHENLSKEEINKITEAIKYVNTKI